MRAHHPLKSLPAITRNTQPPHMITAEGIEAGDLVEGIAIASFDKKRGKWGMKAIQAKTIARDHYDFGGDDDDLE